MQEYEVEAVMKGKVIIKVENEDEAIETAACLDYDEFNWDDFKIKDIRRLDHGEVKSSSF